MGKVLLLDSTSQLSTGKSNEWVATDNSKVEAFVRNIEISEGNGSEDQKKKFRVMISGIPTPWARVMLTRKALCSKDGNADGTTILDGCYKLFKSEWRGLIAAYVLHPESFEFSKPVFLNGRTVEENAGKMSVLNMYGEMLFNELPLWTLKCDGDISRNPAAIQILYFKKNDGTGFNKYQAVGATSPYTLLFTSVNYSLLDARNDIPWIDSDGKFIDPTGMTEESGFKIEEAQRLYSFLAQLTSAVSSGNNSSRDSRKYYLDYLYYLFEMVDMSKYNITYGQIEKNIEEWRDALVNWKDELKKKVESAGKKVSDNIPVSVPIPQGPLSILMNSEHTFYYDNGKFHNTAKENGCEIKSSEIFLDSDYVAAWKSVAGDELRNHANAPVYMIPTEHQEYYLALPLTTKALSVFKPKLSDIMNVRQDIKFVAKVGNDGKVTVECKAVVDATEMTIAKRTYQMEVIPESSGKVFVWPNFKSPQWHKYFFYSEFPTNVTGVRMLPHFEGVDFETATDSQIKHLVTYPVNMVDSTRHKYEIMECASPLEYVEVKLNKGGNDISGGLLCLKIKSNANSTGLIEKKETLVTTPSTVGIDFGSTNTCVYYTKDNNPVAVPFSNRRLAIVGFDNPKTAMAQKDELLFISNEGTLAENGQVKSWLHEHDSLYTNDVLDDEIVGGIPVNESNIPVVAMDEHIIQTNAGRLHYNMKWLSDVEGTNRKTSFIKTLWLQTCADMVSNEGCYPEKVHWSFPSAMGGDDRFDLNTIFSSLAYPFDTKTLKPELLSYTEAESNYSYAMGKNITVDENRMFLGIDVGGSTSDIIIVGEGNSLAAQSSIRIAGGFFFKAINSSAKFRQALYNFHESKRTDIKVLNIADVIHSDSQIYNRAPYYLNNIFDQLHTPRDFKEFYRFMYMNVKQIFALPAYVTGVLLYYSGMLVRNSVEKSGKNGIKELSMRYFGKGGRLFEWLLDVYDDYAEDYLKKCFYAGYGTDNLNFLIGNITTDKNKVDSKLENKSEVAIGLVLSNINQIEGGKNSKRVIEFYDIIGEKGFTFKKAGAEERVLTDMDVIPADIFDGGINLRFPEKMENFDKFLDIYLNFIGPDEIGILKDISDLEAGRNDLNIRAFIQNDPEYQKLFTGKSKGLYRMPIIIAAALSYLNNTLLPAVAKQLR